MNVVQFRELAMVALPEGVLQGIGFAFQKHETPCYAQGLNQALETKEEHA